MNIASIEKRGKNSYRLTVELGQDGRGERIRERKTIRVEGKMTPKKLREYLELEWLKFKMEVEAGAYVAPEKMYFKDFAKDEWLPKFAEKKYSPSNIKNTKSILTTHIIPEFGELRIDSVKTMHCVSFISKLHSPDARKSGKKGRLSGSTILNIYKALDSIFSKAVEWKLITENPMAGVERPKVDRGKPKFYDEQEVQEVIKALYQEPDEWRLYFLGAILGGFRRGELLALEWKDVDFKNNLIHIIKSIPLTVKGEPVETPPKADSEGAVVMPEWYIQELVIYHRQWKKSRLQVMDKWAGGDKEYVFHNGFGKPWHYTTPTGRWRKFIARHDLKYVRLHDLRHTAATLLIEAGVELKAVQERLRHTRYQTTADLYAHVTKKMSKVAASKLDKFNPDHVGPQSVPK